MNTRKNIETLMQFLVANFPVKALRYMYDNENSVHYIQVANSSLFVVNEKFADYCLSKIKEFLNNFGEELYIMPPDDLLSFDNSCITMFPIKTQTVITVKPQTKSTPIVVNLALAA